MGSIYREHDRRIDGFVTSRTTFSIWGELFVAMVVSLFFIAFACHRQTAPAATADVAPLPTDPRTCAAAAVYTKATADDWLQRAVIAQASLNAFKASGAAPENTHGWCGKWAGAALSGPRDPIRWQNALDAVDAVSSGDYALPPACLRVTAVAPSPATQWPGAQCVIGDLVFAEGRPL